jgi:hypothetical protein
LWVPYLQNKLRSCVKILIFCLSQLLSLSGISCATTISASKIIKFDKFNEQSKMRLDCYKYWNQNDWSTDHEIPTLVEFIKRSNQYISVSILNSNTIVSHERVISKRIENTCIRILIQKYCDGSYNVISRNVFGISFFCPFHRIPLKESNWLKRCISRAKNWYNLRKSEFHTNLDSAFHCHQKVIVRLWFHKSCITNSSNIALFLANVANLGDSHW